MKSVVEDMTPEEYNSMRARVHAEVRHREQIAREEGIKSIIMDLRMLLAKLKICSIPNSSFDSYKFMRKHSPLFNKRV